MRVLFIDPPGNKIYAKYNPGGNLNLAIATLTPILVAAGHKVNLFDMMNHHQNRKIEFIKPVLESFKPDVICFSILNTQYQNSIVIIKELRSFTTLPIILGGAEITALAEKVFDDTDNAIDIVVLGEGEEALPSLLKVLERGSVHELETIKGLVIKKAGIPVRTGMPQVVPDLNIYPSPDLTITGIKRFELYRVMGSRGCPFNCSFCFSYLGHTWRERNPDRIINELLAAREKYNFNRYRFLDPIFNFRPEWVYRICYAIENSPIKDMKWEALGVRADTLDDKLAERMAHAGCERVAIGVESLHPEVFKHIKKGETIDQIKKGVSSAVKFFRKVSVFIIIGLQGDTKERSLYTYREVKKLNPTSISFAIAVPYSGTRLEQWVQGHATVLGSSYDSFTRGADAFESGVAFETPEFTKQERADVFRILSTKEFQYVSKSGIHWLLNGFLWVCDVLRYDACNFHKHVYRIIRYYILRLYNRAKSCFLHSRSSYEYEYARVPDGTWWLG
ncbi:B12-binding domain-containing radical SAM protein [Candidatus Omnitrophota bacterium]